MEEDETTGKIKIVKATKNATIMRHPITKNKIVIKSKATSYESALSLARGLTAPILHFDEPEFTNHIKTIVENSFSTYETASRNAKKNHALYCRAFSCTPGDLDTSFGQEAQELLSSTTKWTEKLYDMAYDPENEDRNEVLQYVRDNGSNGIVYIEYSYKQLGLDDKWLHEMYNKIGNPLVVKREILLQRLRGSSESPYDQEDIEHIVSCQQRPVDELYILDHFRIDIYTPLDKRIPYLVGVDCSTGTNADNNAVTIINPFTEKPVAEFKCPYIGESMFERFLIELVQTAIPRAILIIERNSVGDSIIDHLMNSPIANRLYFDKNRDLVQENMNANSKIESLLKKRGEMKKYYGVYTEGNSREAMFAILARRVAEYKEDFVTINIIEDISRLVRSKSGKIAAAVGFHDDSIMSYLIAMYVYYHGNNLVAFGFVKGSQEIENQNQGLRTYDDLQQSGILSRYDVEIIKNQEKVRKENDYEALMRDAIKKAQAQSMALQKHGLAQNRLLDSTPTEIIDDTFDEGDIDMGFFDELNGF